MSQGESFPEEDKLHNDLLGKCAAAKLLADELEQLNLLTKSKKKILAERKGRLAAISVDLEVRNTLASAHKINSSFQALVAETDKIRSTLKEKKEQQATALIQFEAETLQRVQRFVMGPVLHEINHICENIQNLTEDMNQLKQKEEICNTEIRNVCFQMAQEAVVFLPESGCPPEKTSIAALCKIRCELQNSVYDESKMFSEALLEKEMLDRELETYN